MGAVTTARGGDRNSDDPRFAQVIGTGSVMNAPPLLLPARMVLVMGTLVGVGVAAGVLPALRASRVDPAVSLRGA